MKLLLSDAHLGCPGIHKDVDREGLLVRLLEQRQEELEEVILLGDIFDFWFEYRRVIPKDFNRILSCFRSLVKQGVKISYIAGNHDFWHGDFLTKQIGLQVYFTPQERTWDGKRVLLLHGDGLLRRDTAYRLAKKILRHPVNIRLYQLLHPDFGIWLAEKVSQLSSWYHRDYWYREQPSPHQPAYREAARQFLRQGFNTVVIAHLHHGVVEVLPEGTYVNTGEWLWKFNYTEYKDGEFTQYCYPVTNR